MKKAINILYASLLILPIGGCGDGIAPTDMDKGSENALQIGSDRSAAMPYELYPVKPPGCQSRVKFSDQQLPEQSNGYQGEFTYQLYGGSTFPPGLQFDCTVFDTSGGRKHVPNYRCGKSQGDGFSDGGPLKLYKGDYLDNTNRLKVAAPGFLPGTSDSWTGQPADYTWSDPVRVSPEGGAVWDIDPPAVALTREGKGIMAWSQGGKIFLSRRSAADNPFTQGTVISMHEEGFARYPAIALTRYPDGTLDKAVIVWWHQDPTSARSIWGASCPIGAGDCTNLQKLSQGAVLGYGAAAMDGQGDVMAVWEEKAAGDLWPSRIIARTLNQQGWGSITTLVTESSHEQTSGWGVSMNIDFAMNSTGKAVLAYMARRNGSTLLYRKVRSSSSAQFDDEELVSNTDCEVHHVRVAVGENGDATIAFDESLCGGMAVRASHLRASFGGWQPLKTLDQGDSSPQQPKLAMSEIGDVVVTWGRSPTPTTSQICLNDFRRRGGSDIDWLQTPLCFAQNEQGSPLNPQVAMADNGDSVVTWHEINYYETAEVNRREFRGAEWGSVQLVSNPDALSFYPAIAMDSNGGAVIANIARTEEIMMHTLEESHYSALASIHGN